MKPMDELTQEIVNEFASFSTVDAKYAHLFEIGNRLPPMAEEAKRDTNQVRGCQSDLWFDLQYRDGRFTLRADSDSMVIKGIAGLLVRIVENCPPMDIHRLNLNFLDELQIWKLASERNNGLMAMLDHIRRLAAAELGEIDSTHKEGGVDA